MSSRNLSSVYQGTLEAALAVVISVGIGVLADSYFDMSPWFMLAGLGVGFAAFTVRLVRIAGERDKTPTDVLEDEKKEHK